MAEIRCPMCGKSNPDNLEICQQCQARLKPLNISPDGADSGLPDWLKADYEEETPFEEQGEGEDLLARLRVDEDPDPQDDSSLEVESDSSKEPQGDEWLKRIRHLSTEASDEGDAEEEDSPPEETSPANDGIPDWLKSPQEPTFDFSEETQDEPIESELPDWLSTDSVEPQDSIPKTESAEGKFPNLIITDESDTPAQTAESAPEIPDAPLEVESDFPDWLEPAKTDEAPETAAEFPASEDESDLQNWLETKQPDEDPGAPAEFSISEGESDLPDWFESAKTDETPETPADTDAIPDWLTGLEDDDIEIPIILPDPEPETPDWLSSEDAAELSWPSEEETPQSLTEQDNPDWLEKLGGDQISELPDFSPDSDTNAPELPDDSIGEELFEVDELSGLFNDIDDETPAESGDLTSDSIAPAELPGWLEAMRPVETPDDGITEESRGAKVQTGPLVGLRGVLKAEPEIARLKKSTAIATKLQVTDSQQNQVKLLRNILETEGLSKPIRQPIEAASQDILRWIFAFILILVVAGVVFSESQTAPPIPQTAIQASVMDTSQLINAISPQDAVLVSFDYEPGTAGEMEAAAAGVVDHLMIKGAYMTLVSTSPTGPALAERFFSNVQKEHNYVSGVQYINLGYIPGGAAGLLGFVQMPQRITPLSFDGMDAWATTPLNGIYTLSDFKLVLIITDNPDSARTWVEQVQPRLLDTPLIAVASAQAEPILKPYASGENAQIQGIVGGIIDGAAYEQITGKPKLAGEYWDALNYALITAIGAMLFGGIANMISILFRKNKPEEAE